MTMPEGRGKKPIGEWLVAEDLLTQGELLEALGSRMVVDGKRERLGETIARLGFVSQEDISRAVAKQFGLEFANNDLPTAHTGARDLVPEPMARRHGIVPLWNEVDGTLVVLTSDPTDIVAMDDVRLSAGARRIRPIVTPPSRIPEAMKQVFRPDGSRAGDLVDEITSQSAAAKEVEELEEAVEEAGPIIRLAEQIIHDALHGNASDIHVEPGKDKARVRYRVDGVLHEVMTLPRAIHAPLISRLKLIAQLDIAERRRPQDGRSTYRSATGEVDLRVSTLPLLHGEKMVMRLLRKGAEQLQLDEVGLSDQQLDNVLAHIERPQGLCLLTGPTGAGKTSTLYAFLSHLADDSHNLITIEDPVEYELPSVNQTPVNHKIGFTFSSALKTVLRQDPDVVMVGEIRDFDTAELALQASLTGHMVFSTLHTNDAPGAVTRLADLGIPDYLIASSLTMVVAQRLGRRVCSKCAEPHTPTEREIARLRLSREDIEFDGWVKGRGCKACGSTGYKGRIAFLEILSVDKNVRTALLRKAEEDQIRRAARKGGLRSLREDGLTKARMGITTLEEVMRTTPTDLVAEEDAILKELASEDDDAVAKIMAAVEEEATYSAGLLAAGDAEEEPVPSDPPFQRVEVEELERIVESPRHAADSIEAGAAEPKGVAGSALKVDTEVMVADRPSVHDLERMLEDRE
ncbi:GspE/PulE family protein [Euzebya tangerina]|uniref:GspE/PulE family protein n=1 Tax=Euzebya tangerina TaxID=591198 RepID=UPI000E3122E1|nr:GspE/PulE family protein [Euzebya tangerina]